MFRELIRNDRQVTDEQAIELLKQGEFGILSTIDTNGYPYGVPLSYSYFNNAIYFHCALQGHKLDNISNNDKVSFCVVNEAITLPQKFTVAYQSVILYGKASEVSGEEKFDALLSLIEKYSPEYIESGRKYIENDIEKTRVLKIDIERITGKCRPK